MYTLYLDFENGWEEVADSSLYYEKDHRSAFSRVRTMHNGLKSESNKCVFSIKDMALANKISTFGKNISAKVIKDGVVFFTGKIENAGTTTYDSLRMQQREYEILDNWYFLKDTFLTDDVTLENCTLSDPSSTSTSLLHILFSLSGMSLLDVSLPTLNKSIIALNLKEDACIKDLISNILFEAGYVVYAEDNGILSLKDLFPTSISSKAIVSSDIFELVRTDNVIETEYVEVNVTPPLFQANTKIWEDSTGASGVLSASISVPAGTYYPKNASDSLASKVEYKKADYEIILSKNQRLVWSCTGDLSLQENTFRAKDFDLKFHSITGGVITKLQVFGDIYYKGYKNSFTKGFSSPKKTSIDLAFLQDTASADRLACGLYAWYQTAKNTIQFKTYRTDFSIGTFFDFSDSQLSTISGLLRVIKIEDGYDDWSTVTCEAMTALTFGTSTLASTTSNIGTSFIPGIVTATDLEEITANLPTLDNIYEGYSIPDKGATDTPTDLQVSAQGTYKAIIVSWGKQTELTNLKEYQVQVSSNGSTWYSLRFDRVDWKGTADQFTTWNSETLVHTLPDNLVNGSPTPYTLYYRVRQVTRKSIPSNYMTAQATSKIVDSGDIAANSISANQLKVDTINSQIANFSTSVRISPSGFQGQTYGQADCPKYQERRLYLDADELTIQDYALDSSGFNVLLDDKGKIPITTLIGLADNMDFASMYYSRIIVIYDVQINGTYYTKVAMLKKNADSYQFEEKYIYTLMTYDNTTYFRLGQPMDIYSINANDQIVYRYAYKYYDSQTSTYKYYERLGSFYFTTAPYGMQNHTTYDVEKKYETSKSVLMRADNMNVEMCLVYAPPGTTDTTNAQYWGWRTGNWITSGTSTKIADSLLTITGWDDIHKATSSYGYYFVSAVEANICFRIDSATKLPVIIAQPTGLMTGAKVFHLDVYGADYPILLLKNSIEDKTGYLMYDIALLSNSSDTLTNRTVSTKTSTYQAQKSIQVGRYYASGVPSFFLLRHNSDATWNYDNQYFHAVKLIINLGVSPATMTMSDTKSITLPSTWITTNNSMHTKDYTNNGVSRAYETYVFRNSYNGYYQIFDGGFRLYWNDGIKIGKGTNDITCNKVNCNEIASTTVIYAKYAP